MEVATTIGNEPATTPPVTLLPTTTPAEPTTTVVQAPTAITVQALSPTVPSAVVQVALPHTGARENTAMLIIGLVSVLSGLALLGTSRRQSAV